MAKLAIKKGSTDVSVYVFIQTTAAADGSGLTGLVFNSAGLTCYYVRPLAAAAQLSLATLAAATSAHSDGGFKEIDSTNMPGVYRLDLSDAIVASGVNSVAVMLKGAANMAPVVLEVELVAYDPQDSVSLGLTSVAANLVQFKGDAITNDLKENFIESFEEDDLGTLRTNMPAVNGNNYVYASVVQVNDNEFTGAAVPADVVKISGDATAADNLEAAFDGTGYAGGAIKQEVDAVKINGVAAAAVNAAAFFADAAIATGFSALRATRKMFAKLCGLTAGAGTDTEKFYTPGQAVAPAALEETVTVTAEGERTGQTFTL